MAGLCLIAVLPVLSPELGTLRDQVIVALHGRSLGQQVRRGGYPFWATTP